MKIALYTRTDNPSLGDFLEILRANSVDFQINPTATKGCDYAISFGGDGTFLSSVRKMGRECIPIIGVNSGRLGFLSTVQKDDADLAIKELINNNFDTISRSMIKIIGEIPEEIPHRALNEFTIQKSGTAMIMIEIAIDNQDVGTYWADGVIVSTPTGSTAYSMSVGGAILTPGCGSFIISPIAPHNLNIRPLVVPDSSTISLRAITRSNSHAIITIDNREFRAGSGRGFGLVRSKYELQTIHLKGNNYYQTLRDKLLWGVDLRK